MTRCSWKVLGGAIICCCFSRLHLWSTYGPRSENGLQLLHDVTLLLEKSCLLLVADAVCLPDVLYLQRLQLRPSNHLVP